MNTQTRNRRGKDLVSMAQELYNIQKTAVDYSVPIQQMKAEYGHTDPGQASEKVKLTFDGKHFGLNKYSSGQVASYTDIPTKYFRKLQEENPHLLCDNINHGFNRIVQSVAGKKEENRLVRTVEKNGESFVRGFLSGRYRRLDNYDLVEALLPVFQKNELEVVEANLDESKFYIKAVSNRLQTEVKKGDIVRWGVMFSNSDVGAGSLAHTQFVDRVWCNNGMAASEPVRKAHIGAGATDTLDAVALSERTLTLRDKAFFSALQDTVGEYLKPENFEYRVNVLREAAGIPIFTDNAQKVVAEAMKLTGVTGESKEQSILAALATGNEGAGYTKWGLINSFTRAAKNDSWSYQESQELEMAAGKILELDKTSWERIAS